MDQRSRINNDWRDCVDIPLGEESEKYHVDILDGDRVVRTIETTTQSAIYEAFDQITDFKEIKDKISIKYISSLQQWAEGKQPEQ